MEEVRVIFKLDEESGNVVKRKAEELIQAIEKANLLADELAQKIGRMKLGFKVSRV